MALTPYQPSKIPPQLPFDSFLPPAVGARCVRHWRSLPGWRRANDTQPKHFLGRVCGITTPQGRPVVYLLLYVQVTLGRTLDAGMSGDPLKRCYRDTVGGHLGKSGTAQGVEHQVCPDLRHNRHPLELPPKLARVHQSTRRARCLPPSDVAPVSPPSVSLYRYVGRIT